MSRIERLREERIQYMVDQMLPPKPPAGAIGRTSRSSPAGERVCACVVVERM